MTLNIKKSVKKSSKTCFRGSKRTQEYRPARRSTNATGDVRGPLKQSDPNRFASESTESGSLRLVKEVTVVIYVTVRNLSLEKPCLQPEVCFVCAVAVESPPPPGGGGVVVY